MKTINYMKKITSARTVYVDVDAVDKQLVIDKILSILNAPKDIAYQVYTAVRTSKISKGRTGANTPEDYLLGVYENIAVNKTDLSLLQIRDLKTIFDQVEAIGKYNTNEYTGFESVLFQEASGKNKEENNQENTFMELFEITIPSITLIIRSLQPR